MVGEFVAILFTHYSWIYGAFCESLDMWVFVRMHVFVHGYLIMSQELNSQNNHYIICHSVRFDFATEKFGFVHWMMRFVVYAICIAHLESQPLLMAWNIADTFKLCRCDFAANSLGNFHSFNLNFFYSFFSSTKFRPIQSNKRNIFWKNT